MGSGEADRLLCRDIVNYAANLKLCGFSNEFGPESLETIAELERRIGVPLPADYRNFLRETGGGYLDACVSATVPAPFIETHVSCVNNIKDVTDLLNSWITPRNMICIGSGHFDCTICLSIAGLDHGHVYCLDGEMRSSWDEERISRWNLPSEIREFFRLRDADDLPPRPWGYDHCYHLADSFIEFLSKLRRDPDADA